MRVVHIITSLAVGGAERMLLKLVEALPDRFESHVICLGREQTLASELRRAGAVVHSLGMGRSVIASPVAIWRLAGLLRSLEPHAVQTWLYHADLIGGLAARWSGAGAVVWNIRSYELPDAAPMTSRLVVRSCAWLSHTVPTVIVCCSQAARAFHERRGFDPRRFVVIPNGFDLKRFDPDDIARQSVRRERKIPPEAPLIGLVARLDPLKNHALFFAAAKMLHAVRPDAHFLLVGRGIEAESPQVRRWVAEAGIGPVTHLLGERSDVQRLTAAMDVATCCSSSEAFPNMIGEAMASAVPCVTTDVGDAAAIVGDTGTVVPRADARALADAWCELIEAPAEQRRRLGQAARARIASHFDIRSVARRYADLYDSLARGATVAEIPR